MAVRINCINFVVVLYVTAVTMYFVVVLVCARAVTMAANIYFLYTYFIEEILLTTQQQDIINCLHNTVLATCQKKSKIITEQKIHYI